MDVALNPAAYPRQPIPEPRKSPRGLKGRPQSSQSSIPTSTVRAMERLRHFFWEENLRAAFQAADARQPHRAEALCFVRAAFQADGTPFDKLRIILNRSLCIVAPFLLTPLTPCRSQDMEPTSFLSSTLPTVASRSALLRGFGYRRILRYDNIQADYFEVVAGQFV